MGDAACLGDGDDVLCAHLPCQHDLCGRGIVPAGYLHQRLVVAQPSFTERRIGHHGYAVPSAPRDKVVLDAPVAQVVEYLIGGTLLAVRQGKDMLHVRHVEVAHTPLPDFPFLLQLRQSTDGLGERVVSDPVQQVKVDVIRAEPLQTPFAGPFRAFVAGIARKNFADYESLVTALPYGFAYEIFRTVHLGGVYQRQSEVDAPTQGLYLLAAPAPHLVGPLSERADLPPVGESYHSLSHHVPYHFSRFSPSL